MTVYLDIVLLENICMNYIILFATGIINKAKINQIKLLLSSTLGSIYAVISFTTNLQIYSNLIIKVLLSIVMINIAFKAETIKKCLKQLIIFYLTSFAFGGCAFFLLYYIKPQNILMRNGIYIGSYPIKIALLGGILGFIIINIAFKLIKGKITKKDMFCKVIIQIEGKQTQTLAMIDTGNLLKDPITKVPVIVVEEEKLKEIIEEEVLKEINKTLEGEEVNLPQEYLSRIRLIPFASLGKQNGMLVGIKPDKIIINFDDEVNEIKNVIVGMYNKKIAPNNKYQAIMGLDLIQGSEKVEK